MKLVWDGEKDRFTNRQLDLVTYRAAIKSNKFLILRKVSPAPKI